MTVKELIEKLSQLPQGHQVVVAQHSQYAHAGEPILIEAYDNGGYVSHPFRPEEKLKAHGYVYIPSE